MTARETPLHQAGRLRLIARPGAVRFIVLAVGLGTAGVSYEALQVVDGKASVDLLSQSVLSGIFAGGMAWAALKSRVDQNGRDIEAEQRARKEADVAMRGEFGAMAETLADLRVMVGEVRGYLRNHPQYGPNGKGEN